MSAVDAFFDALPVEEKQRRLRWMALHAKAEAAKVAVLVCADIVAYEPERVAELRIAVEAWRAACDRLAAHYEEEP